MHHTEFAARRRSLELSQSELARRLGVPDNTIARWERGDLRIQHGTVLRLALESIEDDLREEWEKLPPEEKVRRNRERFEQKATEFEASLTPEQRKAAERWFSPH